ncbi:hypothetical protein BZA70DRAFT_124789 [Myxozyma melibiosi]|uniref:Uncharacterized protein n=1 Tax=Myxozyma melibiosi TaxID=54550 RepID=A0ABR1FAH7_9ASCO
MLFSVSDEEYWEAWLTVYRAEIWESLTKPRRSQVPDWKTSRTRRTYLVSLGMPVDLDQVLPTKQTQEKLVLSLKQKKRLSANAGGSQSTETTASRASSSSDKPITPLSHANTATLQPTHASAPVSRTETPVAVPEFDVDRARQLSRVSVAALENMSTAELQSHVEELEQVKVDAAKYLAYWIDMRNTSEEDKAKYEGVIESSIEYAQRLRKHTTKQAALPRLSGLSRTKSLHNK